MKVKIAIQQEFDLDSDFEFIDDDPYFEENRDQYDVNERVDLLVNRFLEDIDYLVKYDQVIDAITVEYIEE
jgi:hypothetical protein